MEIFIADKHVQYFIGNIDGNIGMAFLGEWSMVNIKFF